VANPECENQGRAGAKFARLRATPVYGSYSRVMDAQPMVQCRTREQTSLSKIVIVSAFQVRELYSGRYRGLRILSSKFSSGVFVILRFKNQFRAGGCNP
jgi:hypothetical protein